MSDIESTIVFEILRSVANREGCEITDLPPLEDTIDVDALKSIVGDVVRIEFEYLDYRIEVVDTEVTVREL